MLLLKLWRKSKLHKYWQKTGYYNNYTRLKKNYHGDKKQFVNLLPGRLWLDAISVVVTTKCNLRCPDCANLMPYYNAPYDVDHDQLLEAIRKLGACIDWIDRFVFIGGEAFLNPHLKDYIAAFPREKCHELKIISNGSIIPQDPELYDVLRRQRVTVYLSSYPSSLETQNRLIEIFKEQGVDYCVPHLTDWIDYGKVVKHDRSAEELKKQFLRCNTSCKLLLNGSIYYCARAAHGYDLGLIGRGEGEYVNVTANTKAQNRRQLRKLMWRRKPITACLYCQKGTDACGYIARGK